MYIIVYIYTHTWCSMGSDVFLSYLEVAMPGTVFRIYSMIFALPGSRDGAPASASEVKLVHVFMTIPARMSPL